MEDVARANVLALKSDATDRFYNVGKGVKTTINELVKILLELTGSQLKPEYKPQEQSFVTERLGSTEQAEKDLGFRAKIDLHAGLKSVVDWRKSEKKAVAG